VLRQSAASPATTLQCFDREEIQQMHHQSKFVKLPASKKNQIRSLTPFEIAQCAAKYEGIYQDLCSCTVRAG
jgi:hypothetical protein